MKTIKQMGLIWLIISILAVIVVMLYGLLPPIFHSCSENPLGFLFDLGIYIKVILLLIIIAIIALLFVDLKVLFFNKSLIRKSNHLRSILLLLFTFIHIIVIIVFFEQLVFGGMFCIGFTCPKCTPLQYFYFYR